MDKDKENVTVEAEEVDDFKQFKERIRAKFISRKKSKWKIIKGRICAVTPIVALASFLLIGFLTGYWHPGWLVFLACPVMPIILSLFDGGTKERVLAFVSITVSIAYVVVGITLQIWHPTWVAFFLIPITAILIGLDRD